MWIVEMERRYDERGMLLKFFDSKAFSGARLNTIWDQTLITRTSEPGTIRGLHWQADPQPEIKLVTCLRGAIWDCVVDIRPDSPTFGCWDAFEITAASPRAVYIPAGYAHGLQTLEPDTEVHYQISAQYHPELQRGLRWNDPTIVLPWPIQNAKLSPRDKAHPALLELK